jgi:hypothetical protein
VIDASPTESTTLLRSAANGEELRANFFAVVASDLSVSLDLGSFGFGAPNVVCGTASAGTAHFEGCITTTISGLTLDKDAYPDCGKLEIEVIGKPAGVSLAAEPPAIACDGVASSTVTATVTNKDGKPVIDGNEVSFSVQVLGTASPLAAKTVGGAAASTITPLAGGLSGVPVIVTVGPKTLMKHTLEMVNDGFDDDGDGVVDDRGTPSDPPEYDDIVTPNPDHFEASTLGQVRRRFRRRHSAGRTAGRRQHSAWRHDRRP